MTLTTNNLKIVYGGASFNSGYGATAKDIGDVLEFLKKEGIVTLDTGQAYGDSEELIGAAKAASRGFTLDTKVAGGLWPTVHTTKETVIKAGEESLKKLDTDQVDVYYIHAPDRKVPIQDTLEGINELYKAGKFRRFGLSNFRPEEVEEVVRVAKENNFVLPSVFQGNYNAAGRRPDTDLFPILRQHNIAFYAYSPIAGGFLTKTPDDINVHGKGRFEKGSFFGNMYNSLYNKPAMLNFLVEFGKVASSEGIPQAELAYRWVTYHSQLSAESGDAIIIGSRYGSQLTSTIEGLKKGPLKEESAQKLDELWKGIEEEAILDNFNNFISLAN
ncbi:uncharacterized protein TRUGW13939_01352 [Talaromyces rugulosus]|uniref:NADP-dependent oxidoreductase domain-containing protein n=1 Tax=Talaromyces rugulosus TaxID=121627 RepID=A0A7H8QK16_TALRU|nr:uncharacterized protein TRUGW13939_01352 [Talaromyces rugulosus]QKX54267.1 hypothetical protein TRUGW13939_01352 [Talaromyces rugulosus]